MTEGSTDMPRSSGFAGSVPALQQDHSARCLGAGSGRRFALSAVAPARMQPWEQAHSQ